MYNTLLIILLMTFIIACESSAPDQNEAVSSEISESVRLQDSLDRMRQNFESTASAEKQTAYNRAIREIEESGMLETAKKQGEKAPDFTLTNAVGEKVNLYEELKKGPVVLTWYRGGWCPYCNVYLHYLQEKLPEIKQQGAQILALTPEKPDSTLTTAEKNELEFQVLSDLNNEVARKYGLVFKLDEEVSRFYKESFSLIDYNDTDSDELPLSATYIIDTDGTIRYSFIDADYRKRAEPDEIVSELTNMNQ